MELYFSIDDDETRRRLYKLTPYLMEKLLNWISLNGYSIPPELNELSGQVNDLSE